MNHLQWCYDRLLVTILQSYLMRQRLRLFVRSIAEAEKSYMWKGFLLADVCLAPVIAIVSDID